jgi:uncharacterized protein (DUF2141 family)
VALALAWTLTSAANPVGRLEVDLAGVRSAKGLVRICLTADPAAFPACHKDARAVRRNIPAGTRSVTLEGLAPGTYALAVMHDENANHRLDTFAGIPREGFGFSRNPAIGFGPPRFAAARFETAGEATTQQVRLHYIL